jgi:hypothetical protein
MSSRVTRRMRGAALVLALAAFVLITKTSAQQDLADEIVRTLEPPRDPLPPESASAGVRKFSFIAYGDTRGARDGEVIHPDHAKLVDQMLAEMKKEATNGFPVKFVVQSGDGVLRGRVGRMWNVSFLPIIQRLITEGDVPYYFAVGNHDAGTGSRVDREKGLKNSGDAMKKLWPPEGSPRRLNGYATYAFGYGNLFVIVLDSNIPDDGVQYAWVQHQLEALDRNRFPIVAAVYHHPEMSSGPHGGLTLEPQAAGIRRLYLPLFRKYHVRMTLTGHEHFLEHWIEHYQDGRNTYRMDHIVEGGGGAPTYVFNATPDARLFEDMAKPQKVTVTPLVQPGPKPEDNPHSFMIVEVDGERIWVRVVAEGDVPYSPYGRDRIELTD